MLMCDMSIKTKESEESSQIGFSRIGNTMVLFYDTHTMMIHTMIFGVDFGTHSKACLARLRDLTSLDFLVLEL